MSQPTAPPAREYDEYNGAPALVEVGRAVFGEDYRGQKSSVWPADLVAMTRRAGLDTSGHFLDAGCGSGWASAVLSEQIGCTGEAWDVSASNAALAHDLLAPAGRVTARQRDFHNTDGYEHAFGLVLSIGAVYWSDDPTRLARSWAALLRPGGAVLVFLSQLVDDDGAPIALAGTSPTAAACDWPATFAAAGLDVEVSDQTSRFVLWLDRWTTELDARRDAVERELGTDGWAEFRGRFDALHLAAADGRLVRTALIGRAAAQVSGGAGR